MITIYTDGATEGWNGKIGTVTHCGIGFYCEDTQYQYSARIEAKSNNEAEFYALIEAMKWAISQGYKEVLFKLDSKIVVDRVTGKTKLTSEIKKNKLNKKFNLDRRLIMDGFSKIVFGLKNKFSYCNFVWIPREQNTMADYLSTYMLKK